MLKNNRQLVCLFIMLVVACVSLAILPSQTARASEDRLKPIVEAWSGYHHMAYCMTNAPLYEDDAWVDGISNFATYDDVIGGKIFLKDVGNADGMSEGNYAAPVGIFQGYGSSTIGCFNANSVMESLKHLGYNGESGMLRAVCDAGSRVARTALDETSPGPGDVSFPDCSKAESGDKFIGTIEGNDYTGKIDFDKFSDQAGNNGGVQTDFKNSSPAKYYYYMQIFQKGCLKTASGVPMGTTYSSYSDTSTGGANEYEVNIWDPAQRKMVIKYISSEVDTKSDRLYYQSPEATVEMYYQYLLDPDELLFQENRTCKDVVGIIDTYSKAFGKYRLTYPDEEDSSTGSAKSANISSGDGIDDSGTGNGATTCAIDGVGWIVCPVVRFMAWVADAAFTFLADSFLNIKPEVFQNTSTKEAWGKIRNLANVAFAIAFLVLVYSQLTGMGMSNYGVKRMLPRLIVAAILVNVSYYICQIAVDISNILGFGLKDLSGLITVGKSGSSDISGVWGGNNPITNLAGEIIAGGAALGLMALNIAALIPILITAIVALVMILFILVIRQAAVIMLIVLSPLAFVCFLLPNTEGLFKKWQKSFTSLLMVFPIIGLIYGLSLVTSEILAKTMTGTMGKIVSMAVLVLPLFAVPVILKKSLDGLGKIGAMVSGIGGKIGGKASDKWSNSRLNQHWQSNIKRDRALVQGGAYTGKNPFKSLSSKAYARFNDSKISGRLGDRAKTRGYAIQDEENAGLTKDAGSRLDNMMFDDSPLTQSQMMQIAMGKDVTRERRDEHGNIVRDENGNVVHDTLMKADKFDRFMQRAAIQNAAKIATVDEAQQLIDAAGAKDAKGNNIMGVGERKTLKSALASSPVVNKAPYLTGKILGDIEQGTSSSSAAISSYLQDGKLTAESLTTMDPAAIENLVNHAFATPGNSNERRALRDAYAKYSAPTGDKLRAAAGVGRHDKIELIRSRLG